MSWTSETNIKGPKGDKGDKGDQGDPGVSGSGSGDVAGPAGAVADRIAVYNGTTGKIIKDGGKTIAELGGSSASGITVTPAGNIAATNVQAALVELDTEKVAKAGDTMTGNLLVNKANPALALQKTASGQTNQFVGYTGVNARWQIQMGDSTTETGSGNAGSNFVIARYNDAGTAIDAPLTVARTDGSTTLTGMLTLPATAPSTGNHATNKTYVDAQIVAKAVRYDAAQGLTSAQMSQGRANIAVTKRNYIINGAFQINQGGYVSGAVLTSPAYGHDQWKAGAAGGDYSFTQSTSSTTITIAAGKSLIQPIEDIRVVGGGSYVLAWTGTAQARAGVNTLTPSGAYAASPLLITGQTDGTVMSVEFNAGTLGSVGLYEGNVAPPFQLPDYPAELALCQRYYSKLSPPSGTFVAPGFCFNTTLGLCVIKYNPMRAAPAITPSAAGHYVFTLPAGSPTLTNLTFSPGAEIARIDCTTTGLTTGQGGMLQSNSASATITFSARL